MQVGYDQYNYVALTAYQVDHLKKAEGNAVGTGVLAPLMDQAIAGATLAGTANTTATTALATANSAQTTANAALPAAKLVVRTGTVPAGSATPTAAVTGLLTTDTILAVNQLVAGANSLPIIGRAASCAVNGQLALSYSADPGASGTIAVLVKTA